MRRLSFHLRSQLMLRSLLLVAVVAVALPAARAADPTAAKPGAAEPAGQPASPLQDLAWLVGEWGDTGPDTAISTTIRWTKNKTFLSYSFKASAPGMDDLEGTQVIGWDPAAGTIRSWMFDSDGGFGEGTWTKKGNRWIIKFKQVMPDGRKASATNIYTVVDANTITWQSIGREVDGKFLENVGPIQIVRKAAGK